MEIQIWDYSETTVNLRQTCEIKMAIEATRSKLNVLI